MIHAMVVIITTLLKSTIVNVPLIHISKQIITRNRNIIIIRIPVHICFAFTWDSRCWIFNMASSRFSLPLRSKCSFFRRSTLFLVAIVHTFAWLEVSVSVIHLAFFTFITLSSHSHFVFTDKLELNSWSLVPHFACNLAIFSAHWRIPSCTVRYFFACIHSVHFSLCPFYRSSHIGQINVTFLEPAILVSAGFADLWWKREKTGRKLNSGRRDCGQSKNI